MGREQYKTSEEEVTAEFDRVCQLFQLALGKPSDRVLFDSLMTEANERGMNWIQGLQYVVEQRGPGEAADNVTAPAKTAAAVTTFGAAGALELRRAS